MGSIVVTPSTEFIDNIGQGGSIVVGSSMFMSSVIAAQYASQAEASALEAMNSELSATDSEMISLANANFRGDWVDLAGGLNVPASSRHSNQVWMLVNNLANAALSEPSVSNNDWFTLGSTQQNVKAENVEVELNNVSPPLDSAPTAQAAIDALTVKSNLSQADIDDLTVKSNLSQENADQDRVLNHAMTKAEFDALAEKRIRDDAGSGFAEWGKHIQAVSRENVNEGITTGATEYPDSVLWLGRQNTDAAVDAVSRTAEPIFSVNGIRLAIRNVNNSGNTAFPCAIPFPPAPDGTKTYDSATGVVTEHASAAEAFEGLVTNGDFRNGTTGYTSTGTGFAVVNGIASVNMNTGNNIVCSGTVWKDELVATPIMVRMVAKVPLGVSFDVKHYNVNDGTTLTSYVGSGDFKEYTHRFSTSNLSEGANTVSLVTVSGTTSLVELTNVSLMPVTEQVITSRQDFVFLESFHEKISDKDVVYPLGNVQYGTSSHEGISLSNTVVAQGYSAFGEWDTATKGYGIVWSTLSDANKVKFLQDHENNIYLDGNNLIQVRYRIRVVEGLGDSGWTDRVVVEFGKNGAISYGPAGYIQAKGVETVNTTDILQGNTSKAFFQTGNNSWPKDVEKQYGLTAMNKVRVAVAHNGLCFAVPIALVQRRNQGAYHPTFNPNGCAATIIDGVAGYLDWNHSQVLTNFPIISTAAAFDFGVSGSDRREGGSISNGQKGRPDSKFYDAIYASDVQDLRMSSRRVPVAELREQYKRKAIAGEVRGYEGVPFTTVILHTPTSKGYDSGKGITFVNDSGATFPVHGNSASPTNIPIEGWYLQGASGAVYPLVVTGDSQVYIFGDVQFDFTIGIASHLIRADIQQHKQANPTWTDIIGDPANILATFPNGVEGQWIPNVPDGTSKVYSWNRKNVATYKLFQTLDNGGSWAISGVDDEPTTKNGLNNGNPLGVASNEILLSHYETQAHFTEDAVTQKILDLGEVFASGSHLVVNGGNILTSSLIGKVGTNNVGSQYTESPLTRKAIASSTGQFIASAGYSNVHTPLVLNQASGGVCKTLDYLSSENGVGKLCYVYKEMVWDSVNSNPSNFISIVGNSPIGLSGGDIVYMTSTIHGSRAWVVTATISSLTPDTQLLEYPDGLYRSGIRYMKLWNGTGWGDNNQFEIADNQSVLTDDNSNPALHGTASFDTQHFVH